MQIHILIFLNIRSIELPQGGNGRLDRTPANSGLTRERERERERGRESAQWLIWTQWGHGFVAKLVTFLVVCCEFSGHLIPT